MSNGSGANNRHSGDIVPPPYSPGHLAKLSLDISRILRKSSPSTAQGQCLCSLLFCDQTDEVRVPRTSLNMIPIHIRTATTSDAAAISRIHYEAQDRYNAFYEAVWTDHPRDFLLPLTTLAMEYSKSVFLVATCATTSEVLGFIRYNIIDPSAAVPESETKSDRQLSLEARRPKTKPHLVELWKRFEDIREEEKDACYAKIHQGRRHTCMFCTVPT
jgi:hypothetical protein